MIINLQIKFYGTKQKIISVNQSDSKNCNLQEKPTMANCISYTTHNVFHNAPWGYYSTIERRLDAHLHYANNSTMCVARYKSDVLMEMDKSIVEIVFTWTISAASEYGGRNRSIAA